MSDQSTNTTLVSLYSPFPIFNDRHDIIEYHHLKSNSFRIHDINSDLFLQKRKRTVSRKLYHTTEACPCQVDRQFRSDSHK